MKVTGRCLRLCPNSVLGLWVATAWLLQKREARQPSGLLSKVEYTIVITVLQMSVSIEQSGRLARRDVCIILSGENDGGGNGAAL